MDFEWLAIALGDVIWLGLAFALGLCSKQVRLPPLVGFLVAGFVLNALGAANGELLEKLADLGITLLLFTVGLKINIAALAKPQIWAVTGLHTLTITLVFGFITYGLALIGTPFLTNLDLGSSLLIAFALSFSSTVFVVKALENKGEMSAQYGRIAIGVLIMQDIAAVVFLAIATGKTPSIWALLLLLLIPFRLVLHQVLTRVGRGELLVLYGFVLALGGAKIFELVGMKGDLGALVLGVMIASHIKAEEMAKTMLGFKDLFLLGFFLSIGLTGQLSVQALLIGVLITPLVLLKSALFYTLLSAFNLRARTSLLATINLSNFSEFGLIVLAIGVGQNWLAQEWLTILAIAMSFSFVIAAVLNANASELYARHLKFWKSFQKQERLPEDKPLSLGDATIAVIGMGVVGSGSYDKLHSLYGDKVVGIDIDPMTAANQQLEGRNVLLGDPSDADFWDRLEHAHMLKLIMLTLPKLNASVAVVQQLKESSFNGQIAAIAKFADEAETLRNAGVINVFNVHTEAGAGFAADVTTQLGMHPNSQ